MSRIGKLPIKIPEGVDVVFEKHVCTVKKGQEVLTQTINPAISVEIADGFVHVTRSSEEKEIRSLHGLYRALIANMVHGVSEGYSKKLTIEGIGYRAAKEGKNLVLTVGLSHTVTIPEPQGISFIVDKPNEIVVKGSDKQMVGEMAAKIRAVRPPEPYKGKGIRYENEVVRLKVGKTGAK